MEMFISIKRDWWQKCLNKFKVLIMMKHFRLAIAAYHDYEVWQMDVKTAFLNGNLSEDVYMTQPEGFVNPENAGKVCKLLKSIYGLKQASRSWNLCFDEVAKGLVSSRM